MKKIFILILCLLMLTGCAREEASFNGEDRFIILDGENGIVIDSKTEICYYIVDAYNGDTYVPFYGANKQLVTKDEYLEKYK